MTTVGPVVGPNLLNISRALKIIRVPQAALERKYFRSDTKELVENWGKSSNSFNIFPSDEEILQTLCYAPPISTKPAKSRFYVNDNKGNSTKSKSKTKNRRPVTADSIAVPAATNSTIPTQITDVICETLSARLSLLETGNISVSTVVTSSSVSTSSTRRQTVKEISRQKQQSQEPKTEQSMSPLQEKASSLSRRSFSSRSSRSSSRMFSSDVRFPEFVKSNVHVLFLR